ncbi:MAG: sulfur carrier protein ThiS [Chloroflexota bacterium]
MISLTVNGHERALADETSLAAYLADNHIDPRIVAVEHNGVALRREQFGEVTLRQGDSVEIVRMIGGGC